MLDVAFTELALIAVVAFLILGPKEMPKVIRAVSGFLRQCRDVIDECKQQLDTMADESGINEARKSLTHESGKIKDQFGNWQDTYDLSDIIAEQEADALPSLQASEPKDKP